MASKYHRKKEKEEKKGIVLSMLERREHMQTRADHSG